MKKRKFEFSVGAELGVNTFHKLQRFYDRCFHFITGKAFYMLLIQNELDSSIQNVFEVVKFDIIHKLIKFKSLNKDNKKNYLVNLFQIDTAIHCTGIKKYLIIHTYSINTSAARTICTCFTRRVWGCK